MCRSIFVFTYLKALVVILYNIGDKVLYPMHGAGIIEKIEIQEAETVEEVVEKVNKSKKVRAKKEKDGSVRVKQVLQD